VIDGFLGKRLAVLLGVVAVAGASVASAGARWSGAGEATQPEKKVLQVPMRTDGPKSLDPVEGSTVYDNMACSQIYETLLENKYADPMEMEPRLLAEMPTSDDGGLTWNFTLKDGVKFYDPYDRPEGPLFDGSRTRELTTDDVFYSLKRLASPTGEKNWWLLKDTIAGLDEYKAEQLENETFDLDAPVEGLIKVSDREFKIRLKQPVYRFLYILSMFQTSVVAREAVEYYGDDFGAHPVGTGPFYLTGWVSKSSLTADRNPHYHPVHYPGRREWSREERRLRLHRPAGERVPFVDRIEFTMFVEDQPMWLQFKAGRIGYTQVPAEYYEEAFNPRTGELRESWYADEVQAFKRPLLDFIFRGFNMEDELVGGYSEQDKALRQALSLAVDLEEFNQVFYNGTNLVYDGPIPPGLEGHPEDHAAEAAYRGPNLALARQKLAEAGYPDGEGLPPLEFYTSQGGNNQEQSELLKRQLRRIGVEVDVRLVDFSTLIEFVNKKQAQMFGFAWSSDYPDAENNLALFYSPNVSPGSNHFNYSRPEFDRLYEQILTMEPSEERTRIYERMRDMILEDVPYIGSMARVRHYLVNPWMLNCRPTERYYGWYKYIDVDESKRP